LSICKSLVELKGGTISVVSEPNVGTTFYFDVPYPLSNKDMLDREEIIPEDYTLMGYKRILIAEDVELNQFIATQILESWGMEVAIASNGKEAIEMVEKKTLI